MLNKIRLGDPRGLIRKVDARTVLVSSISILLLVAAALFIFTPPALSLADQAQTKRISSKKTVFYGKVTDTNHKPIRRARVVIYHYKHGRQYIDAVVYTAKNGTYRKVERLRGRTYVQISLRSRGKLIVSKPRRFNVSPGHAYKVNAKLVRRSRIVFLPLFSY